MIQKELEKSFVIQDEVDLTMNHLETTHKNHKYPNPTREEIKSALETYIKLSDFFWSKVDDMLCLGPTNLKQWEQIFFQEDEKWEAIKDNSTAKNKFKMEQLKKVWMYRIKVDCRNVREPEVCDKYFGKDGSEQGEEEHEEDQFDI